MPRILCLILLAAAAPGQTETAALLEAKTLAELRRFDEDSEGALGVAVIDLQSGGAFALNGDAVFPQASVIKIPIMVRMFMAERAGDFRFSDKITLEPRDAAGGSGRIQNDLKKGPVTLTVRELVSAMMLDSDNTATNWCIRAARMERVNGMLASNGFRHTRLRRVMMDGEAARRDDENTSTPEEMARLVELIWRGRIVDPESCREMLEIMKRTKGQFREGLPEGVEAAVKPGGIPGVRTEAGVVFAPGRPFVLAVMSSFGGERSPIPDATRIVYRMFDKLSRANRYGHTVR